MKLLVTHHAPDLDAISSVWMLRRFDAHQFGDSKIAFVNPGDTIDLRTAADLGFSSENIVHCDTGLGMFDHHQPERGKKRVCATSLVYDYVCDIHPEYKDDKALAFISEYVTVIDHFEEHAWPNADDLKYQFMLQSIIEGVRLAGTHDDEALVHLISTCLDGAYAAVSEQIRAQEDIDTKARYFETKWGKAMAIESGNDETIKLGQKQGYVIVVRKDPNRGNIRIKALPGRDIDLTPVYEAIQKKDTEGYWYFHPAKTMLLNGSSKMEQKASPMKLDEIVGIIKALK